jgi:mannose-6-phosphate isomerase-like protein (cupin superfamily)
MKEEEIIMLSKRNVSICGIIVFLFIFLAIPVSLYAADTTSQIITDVDEILNENSLKTGEKSQFIKIAEDDTVTLAVVRTIEGPGLRRHVHKAHDETIYVVRGSGQIFVNDKWVDVRPGSVHFNPMGAMHTSRPTGNEPFVILSIFTPALKEPDRHFVE